MKQTSIEKSVTRRSFLAYTSAGFAATLIAPGTWIVASPDTSPEPIDFQRYSPEKTDCPVIRVTPGDAAYVHTYYDINPFSPSGDQLAVTRFPYQDQPVQYGDTADVCVIDLEEQTIRTLYKTIAWGYQLGANVQWGPNEDYVYTNDVIDGEGVCVGIELSTGKTRAYAGPKYDIAPDGSSVISPRLELMSRTQKGYGVPDNPDQPTPELPPGAAEEEGIWETDLYSNEKSLLVSLADVAGHVADPSYYEGGTFYFWHSKFSPDGSHVMQVLRCIFDDRGGWNPSLFTYRKDGSEIRQVIPRKYWNGHHPNWHPNSKQLLMNLEPRWKGDDTMRFCLVPHKASNMEEVEVLSHDIRGGGHPRIHPDGHFLVADVYQGNSLTKENGDVPLRLINLDTMEEQHFCWIFTDLDRLVDFNTRVDPHPEWSHDGNRICFNAIDEGKRQVMVADMRPLL